VPRLKASKFAPTIGIAAFILTAAEHLFAASFASINYDPLLPRVAPAVLVTTVFALFAAKMRFVTVGGAIAGALVSVAIFVLAGPAGFAALGTVFVLTFVATRIGYARKQRLGMAEHKGGRRAMQVLANLTVAAALGAVAVIFARPWLFICMAAALAEAAADTASSECGEAWSNRVYLITTFKRVAVGTDGGISVAGTLAGVAASASVVWVCYTVHLVPRHGAILAGGAAVIATFADSLLGATLERRRWLDNNAVNFLGTLTAAALAAGMLMS
jgi:uncharacterized protein (TIGR00297 family)